MSFKLSCEAVVAVSMVFFATAFAVTWKDCGELTRSRFCSLPGLGTAIFFPYELATEQSRRFRYFAATEPSISCRVHLISLFLFCPQKT